MNKTAQLIARSSMSLLFFIAGAQKILAPTLMAPLFTALGLPAWFGLVVGIFEVASAVAFVAGIKTRIVAWVLVTWCVLTAFIGHRFWIDPSQVTNFLKNIGLAGAFLLFAIPGARPVQLQEDN